MYSRDELNAMIRESSCMVSELSAKEQIMPGKIERLKCAWNSMKAVWEEHGRLVWQIDTYDVGLGWQGTRREEFEEHKRNIKSTGDSYRTQLEDIGHIISDKHKELTQQLEDITAQKTQESNNIERWRGMLKFAS